MKYRSTSHAAIRYQERVRPTLTVDQARAELDRLLEMEPPSSDRQPGWLTSVEPGTEAFVDIADGIVGTVQRGYLTTVMTRSSSTPSERRAKREERRKKSRARRFQNGLRAPGRHNANGATEWA